MELIRHAVVHVSDEGAGAVALWTFAYEDAVRVLPDAASVNGVGWRLADIREMIRERDRNAKRQLVLARRATGQRDGDENGEACHGAHNFFNTGFKSRTN